MSTPGYNPLALISAVKQKIPVINYYILYLFFGLRFIPSLTLLLLLLLLLASIYYMVCVFG